MLRLFHRPRPRPYVLLAAAMLAVAAAGVLADALDGVLEVRSAYVNVDNGVFLLHARVEYPMNPAIRDALRDGMTLTFDLDTRVERERRFWFDANIVELTLRRELIVSRGERPLRRARRASSGNQENFRDAGRGADRPRHSGRLADPGRAAARWRQYHVSVRAGVRRGRLPASLRALMFWTDDWHRVSEWYSWSLPV